MTIVITLGLHTGCIGGIVITGIFTLSGGGGEFLTFRTGIPGGLAGCHLVPGSLGSKSMGRCNKRPAPFGTWNLSQAHHIPWQYPDNERVNSQKFD